jgi:hypothetical protein
MSIDQPARNAVATRSILMGALGSLHPRLYADSRDCGPAQRFWVVGPLRDWGHCQKRTVLT